MDATSTILHQITGVPEFLDAHEVFLDASRTNKPIIEANTSSLVIRPTPPRSAERLLSHNSARAFFVIVYIACCISEFVGCRKEGCTRGREAVSK